MGSSTQNGSNGYEDQKKAWVEVDRHPKISNKIAYYQGFDPQPNMIEDLDLRTSLKGM